MSHPTNEAPKHSGVQTLFHWGVLGLILRRFCKGAWAKPAVRLSLSLFLVACGIAAFLFAPEGALPALGRLAPAEVTRISIFEGTVGGGGGAQVILEDPEEIAPLVALIQQTRVRRALTTAAENQPDRNYTVELETSGGELFLFCWGDRTYRGQGSMDGQIIGENLLEPALAAYF